MEIKQHFLKNKDFKTVKSDGVFGGVTPFGDINMVIFTDRLPIPDSITIEVDDKTGKITEIARESKQGIVKEVQFGIKFDLQVAKQTVDWLQDKINQLEEALNNG